jgi:copper chaperone CopZ
MYEDTLKYIRGVYRNAGQEFTMASPFAQLVKVTLNLGRMILFYIETSITELNIESAHHARSVRGLAALTGHTPSSGIAARGSLYMTYNMSSDYMGETVVIKNHTKIKNTSNGLTYIAMLPSSSMRLTVGAYDSKVEIPVIQGVIKYQQATGNGESMQSYNFANKSGDIVDNFFVNVYVNNKRWAAVDSMLDMGYNQHCCVIKPSFNGGIDVFFGTGINGAVPQQGSTILFEYLASSGSLGNIYDSEEQSYWEFEDSGYTASGDYVNLNDIYNLSPASDMLFGTERETIEMTRKLAPNMSRSFVLANATNYKYFLTKLNMFSIIDAFSGFNVTDDANLEAKYTTAKDSYASIKEKYTKQINLTGVDSVEAQDLKKSMEDARNEMEVLKTKCDEAKLDDNVIYLYLVPDITKRLSDGENYFTCSLDRFTLSDDEKNGLLSLIEDSGQKIITIDNRIVDPKFVRFAINIFIQMWSNYNFDSVKSGIITNISNYLIHNTRRDRVPVSDLIRIVESVPGVDSVSIFFDADRNNSKYYGEGIYGIDEYGDIILSRTITDSIGNKVEVNDLLPLFRGPFVSCNDIEYSDDLDSLTCSVNVTLRGKS